MVESEDDFKKQLADIKHDIRDSMQHVQLQFEVLKNAVDTCQVDTIEMKYGDCAEAVDNAIMESTKFIEFNVKLVKQMSGLRKLVHSQEMKEYRNKMSKYKT